MNHAINQCAAVAMVNTKNADTEITGQCHVGAITACDSANQTYQVNHDVEGVTADGLLIEPTIGDIVVYLIYQNQPYIIQILTQRADKRVIRSSHPIDMHAPQVDISATHALNLSTLGKFSLFGDHGVISAASSLVSVTQNMVQQVGQLLQTAKGLIRSNARQQVITAEQDVRIDGKRINMG